MNSLPIFHSTQGGGSDFVAEEKDGKPVLIECKGTARESAVEQIIDCQKEYDKEKNPRLVIVAFKIDQRCISAAKKHE
ncbi:MAG: hypothetical protein QXH17_08040 [Candidatus Bathyarchaeia archaeon]